MMKRTQSLKRILSLALLVAAIAGLLPVQAAHYETIRPGDQGENVRQMQRALHFLGFELKDDGKYGNMTTQAVQLFQARMRLHQDGLAGNRTLTALYDLAPQFKPQQQGSDKPEAPAPPPQAPQPDTAAGYDTATVITPNQGSLNLRRTAARQQNTIYQIPHGTVVRVLGISGAWVRVETAGRVGYVQQEYLKPGAVAVPKPTTPQPTNIPAPQQPVTTPEPAVPGPALGQAQVHTPNQGSLNLRRSASRNQNTFYQIPHGTVVRVISTSGIWTQVDADGRVGFVQSSYLKPVGTVPTTAPSTTPVETPPPANGGTPSGSAFVHTSNGKSLNLRAQARNGNNIIATIPFGGEVQVLDRGSSWCRVSYLGRAGYVMTSFLRFAQDTPAPTQPPEESPAPSETPDNPPGNAFPRILRLGSRGEDVRLLQEKLIALKYVCDLTGSFDSATQIALKQFQSLNGLTADGILGSQSASVLLSGSARDADSAPLGYTDLSLGSVDKEQKQVTALQKALKDLGYRLTVNGRFDTDTHQAVVDFQQINGLPITGIANALTQSKLYSGSAKRYTSDGTSVDTGGATGKGPSSGQVRLLHWYNDVKKSASSGQKFMVYHPGSGLSFNLRFYSMGSHADSEPLTLRDTQLMNKALGPASWNIRVVYVKLPDGRWTMAAMHNRPHLSGNIKDNGFDGHLCVHFLRDLDEVTKNDPNYGLSNQKAIRKAWERLTGEKLEK